MLSLASSRALCVPRHAFKVGLSERRAILRSSQQTTESLELWKLSVKSVVKEQVRSNIKLLFTMALPVRKVRLFKQQQRQSRQIRVGRYILVVDYSRT